MTCLFATGGKDLKSLLRGGATDDEITEAISKVWSLRSDRYSELRESNTEWSQNNEENAAGAKKIEMYQIGG